MPAVSSSMCAEDLSEALAEYEKAVKDFEAVYRRVVQHLHDRELPNPGELREIERARLRLSAAHRAIAAKVTGR